MINIDLRFAFAVRLCALAALAYAIGPPPLHAQHCKQSGKPCILTGQYTNQRDGHNGNELKLVCPTTGSCTLGLQQVLTSAGATLLQVDPSVGGNDLPQITTNGGSTFYQATANPIYAQPLYVPGLSVASPANTANCNHGGTCDMLVAATLNGTLFAWNADTGLPLWSRQGGPNPNGSNSNALWYDDCNNLNVTASAVPTRGGPLQFIGTVSTPVIDITNQPTGYQAVMYVTSFCQAKNDTTGATTAQWYLHEVDLATGLDVCAGGAYNSSNVCVGGTPQRVNVQPTATCGDGAVGCTSGSLPFSAYGQNQRPALLEVQNPSLNPNHLIYIAFGAFENALQSPEGVYHGWLVSYTTDSFGNLSQPTVQGSPLQFASSAKGADSGNTDQPACDNAFEAALNGGPMPLPPNLCGHLATFWSSTRGPAATNYNDLGDNAFDIFLPTANGPFQDLDSNGNVLTNGQNWGESTLRFQMSSQTGMGVAPYQSFTPYGQEQFAWDMVHNVLKQNCGPITSYSPASYTAATYTPCTPAIQPPQVDSTCPAYCPAGAAWCPCSHSFEVANSNDWDMGTSGELLFKDLSGNWKLLTMDKAGYGYLLNPADLCNGSGCTGTANTTYSFAQGDPGNFFPFAAAHYLCPYPPLETLGGNQQQECDRPTSLAFYNNWLYLWPSNQITHVANGERLTALKLSDWTTQTPFTGAAGTISSWTQNAGGAGDGSNDGQTHVTGSGTSFTTQVIPGDELAACGCTPPGCPIITYVASNTALTLSQLPSCSPSSGAVSYAGYFINPRSNTSPNPENVGYPGGSLMVASTTGENNAVVYAVTAANSAASLCGGNPCHSGSTIRTQGTLHAYQAPHEGPGAPTSMPELWNSSECVNCQTFCSSPFALPTVANGRLYLPTYAINNDGTTYCPDRAPNQSYLSGLLVYGLN